MNSKEQAVAKLMAELKRGEDSVKSEDDWMSHDKIMKEFIELDGIDQAIFETEKEVFEGAKIVDAKEAKEHLDCKYYGNIYNLDITKMTAE